MDDLYDFLEHTYDYLFQNHGLDSFDGAGATILGVANWDGPASNDCPNAFWNGQAIWFCTGLAVDDVVHHELTHAVTQFSAGLIYQNESGALNEAFSDIFGELIDLDTVHGDGSASPWLMGEGSSLGAIRSLSNPPAYGDPDRGSRFVCTAGDNGGVHINSGIPNKAAYLMADGGSFNGQTVAPIGRLATSSVHFRALTQYLTPASNFLAHYNAMMQSCEDLYGAGSGNCAAVEDALLATEMNGVESCGVACPVALAVNAADDEQPGLGTQLFGTLYALRTQVLGSSAYGRRLTDLYYRHAATVAGLVDEDPGLRAQLLVLVGRMAEGVEALRAQDESVRVTPHTAALFASVLRRLEQADPEGELGIDVRRERLRLAPEELVGKSFPAAWEAILRSAGE